MPGNMYPFRFTTFMADNAFAMVAVLQDAFLAIGTKVLSVVR